MGNSLSKRLKGNLNKQREKTEKVLKELNRLHLKSKDKILTVETVLLAAKNPGSILHEYFEWDNKKAGHEWRKQQARLLLTRYRIIYKEGGIKIPIRVSLASDRTEDGGGYRLTKEVLSDDLLKAELMRTAIMELESWTKRYSMLRELCEKVKEIIFFEKKLVEIEDRGDPNRRGIRYFLDRKDRSDSESLGLE